MSDRKLDSAALDQVVALVHDRIGIRVTGRNLELLQRLVQSRLSALDVSVEGYLQRLVESAPEGEELERITQELTVGETYFFRGPQLAELRDQLLPELIEHRRRESPRSLRILSAGCATGEEPYTLVMLLSELLPDFAEWQISVVGLDINRAFLRRAEQATYARWSLRDVPDVVVERHFTETAGRFQVRPDLVSKVRFQYANLALDPLPAPALGVLAMDLILCRNVIIYFEHDVRDVVTDKLVRCLAPDGYLMFGPADLLGATVPSCRTRNFGELLAFQRTWRRTIPPGPPPSSRPRPPSRFPTPPPGLLTAVRPSPVPIHPPEAVAAPARLEAVHVLANDGNLGGALDCLRAILEAEPERADAHALHGFLLTEAGDLAAAFEAFRRSTYLDSSMLLAHAGAAMTARRLGQTAAAERASARVRQLAKQQPPDALVSGWEGMTAGRLLRLFEGQLDGSLR
jgi:chemotaxis protein methyltransferase CheR